MKKYKCKWCKKAFKDYPSNKRSTCSRECQRAKSGAERKGKPFGLALRSGYKRKPFSEEHRQRLSEAKKRNPSPHAFKEGVTVFSGEQHYNWQGGKTPENQRLRRSKEYRAWRKKVFERDNYTCQECKQRGGYLEADHIKPWALYTELRFELTNGRTLCLSCHRKSPTFGKKVLKLSIV